MKLDTLYKRDTTGKIQQWTIEVKDGAYRTISGEVDGKLTTTEWSECEGKNTGRANETTAKAQAEREAKAKYKKKTEEGYTTSPDNVDEAAVFQVMLAHKWEDYGEDIVYPVYCQEKLDGIRCRLGLDGMWSRKNKLITSCPHIQAELAKCNEEAKKKTNGTILYKGVYLDGELYNHEFKDDFNKICSIVRKQKPSDEELELSEQFMQFWCYDIIIPNAKFVARNNIRDFMFHEYDFKYIKKCPTYIAHNRKELDEYNVQFLEAGYEGQIIREDTPYQNKRSKHLLKRKEFETEEYDIVSVQEGVGGAKGLAATMTFKTKDGLYFDSTVKGTVEFRQELWRIKDELPGQRATIRFCRLTPDGKPKCSNVIEVRNYE